MSLNFLSLKVNQTEVIVFGHGPIASDIHSYVKILGVYSESTLEFIKQMSSVVTSSFP